MAIKIFKLEVTGPKEKIDFGPRSFGEVGRDILAVKYALGAIENFSSAISSEKSEQIESIEDPNGWFSCVSGKPLSNLEAATFEETLQQYVAKFQMDNQFYILCYLFTKFAIPKYLAETSEIVRTQEFETRDQRVIGELENLNPTWVEQSDQGAAAKIVMPAGSIIQIDDLSEYRYHALLAKQLELITKMFDSEFGKLGEATLAVMHGWLPRTTIGQYGYMHDPRVFQGEQFAYDVVLEGLLRAFVGNSLTQKLPRQGENSDINLPREDGVSKRNYYDEGSNGSVVDEYITNYNRQVALKERIVFSDDALDENFRYEGKHFGVVRYNLRSQDYKSVLYSSVEKVSELFPRPNNVSSLSSRDYADALNRNLEPDPLIDPDPFIISNSEIGYFYRTEYTLDNLPPLPPSSEIEEPNQEYKSAIRALEDSALTDVLEFYGKPEIFYLDTTDSKYQDIFIGIDEQFFKSSDNRTDIRPSHNGSINNENTWVVGTRKNMRDLRVQSRYPGAIQPYDKVEREEDDSLYVYGNIPQEPLIRFVEFRTPSLRPGDVYRAKFIINRKKLEYISLGFTTEEVREQIETLISEDAAKSDLTKNEALDLTAHCDDDGFGQSSKEDQKRRYEEYKSLASKKKKEIARILREKTLETYNNENSANSIDIDLGVFGNANLNFEGFTADSYNYTTDVLNVFGGLLQSSSDKAAKNPEIKDGGSLNITYPDLVDRVDFVTKEIKQAYRATQEDRIGWNDSSFNGDSAARLLSNVPPELRNYIRRNIIPKGTPVDFSGEFGGLGADDINIRFEQAGPSGIKISRMKVGNRFVDLQSLSEYPSLSDPRTMTYLAQIEEMSGGPTATSLSFVSAFLSPTDACREIGIGKRGAGFLVRHTPGLKPVLQEYNPLNQWYKENVEDPYNKWLGQSKANFDDLFKPDFNTDELLALMGKRCTFKTLYREFANKISLSGFLCDFLKCIRLPGINLKIPKLTLPPLPPKIEIFGWYAGLVEALIKNFIPILERFLCTFIRMIIDFLRYPLCQEQLRDQLYGQSSSGSPIMQQALVDGLTDLGLKPENVEKSKEFVDDALKFLTGNEICRLLNGETLDPATTAMLERLAKRVGIDELNSEQAIINFFETIGIFLPAGFCDDLTQADWLIGSSNCEDTTSYVDQIRKRMLAGDATEDEIARAVELANKNLQDQAEKLQALGETGLKGLLPDIVNFGDPNAVLNELPAALMDATVKSAKDVFEPAKMGYLSSLSSFGPSLYLNAPRLPRPGDDAFNEESSIIVDTILQNLNLFQKYVSDLSPEDQTDVTSYIRQLHLLYQVYEVVDDSGSKVLGTYKYIGPRDTNPNPLKGNEIYAEDKFEKVSYYSRDRIDPKFIYFKPVGYSETEFYREIRSAIESYSTQPEKSHHDLGSIDWVVPETWDEDVYSGPSPAPVFKDFSFFTSYLLYKQAELPIKQNDDVLDGGQASVGPEESKKILTNQINIRLQELQSLLAVHLDKVASPVSSAQYLSVIKELLDFSLETVRENDRRDNELINMDHTSGRPKRLTFSLGAGSLAAAVRYQEFESTGLGATNIFDPYALEIYNDNMFNATEDDPIEITFCDTIPGPDNEEDGNIYREAISDIPSGIYTRRELFSRRILQNINRQADKYFPNNQRQGEIREDINLLADFKNPENSLRRALYSNKYSELLEGISEQVFFSLRNSRLYGEGEQNYYPGLQRRVAGETYITEDNCYKNRYNVSQLGILSFEKMITDELSMQIKSELSKPENSPFNIDYDDIGPVEKAIQNVCLTGFIRVCLVELLLKGSLAYSVWDLEAVFDEPMMQEFIYKYIEHELNRKATMAKNWERIINRITGIENHRIALKKVVQQQSMKMLDLSKKIFDNPPSSDVDYYNWYSKYFIPISHCSRALTFKAADGESVVKRTFIDENGQIDPAMADRYEDSNLETIAAPATIYWDHPLLDEKNVILEGFDSPMLDGRNMLEVAAQAVAGNDPFFHIEHLLHVRGPLASLESLVVPSDLIIRNVLQVDPSKQGVSEALVTEIENRIPERLNLMDSRARYTNIPRIQPELYGFVATPELPEAARLSSAEQVQEYGSNNVAERSEVYHIDDFVEGVRFAVSGDDLEKFFCHMRGVMHFEEDEAKIEEFKQAGFEDTKIFLLKDYPETVRRTPTRFIKKTRKIVKIKKDFISHNVDDLFDSSDNQRSVYEYKKALFSTSGPDNYLRGAGQLALSRSQIFKEYVEVENQSEEYYVLSENFEDYMNAFIEEGNLKRIPEANGMFSTFKESAEAQIDDIFTGRSNKVNYANLIYPNVFVGQNPAMDQAFPATEEYKISRLTNDEQLAYLQGFGTKFRIYNRNLTSVREEISNKLGGISTRETLPQDTYPDGIADDKKDVIRYSQSNDDADREIFSNKTGKFNNLESYNEAKRKFNQIEHPKGRGTEPLEEHWHETVYDFSGKASILAGIYGSFTIGETFDPAVLNFEPSAQVTREFNTSLKSLIQTWSGKWNLSEVRGTSDPKLTSYGRTFFCRENIGLDGTVYSWEKPYIARPMGIDKHTNLKLTSKLLLRSKYRNDENNSYDSYFQPFRMAPILYSDEQESHHDDTLRPDLPEIIKGSDGLPERAEDWSQTTYRDICKMVHGQPAMSLQADGKVRLTYSNTDVLPPNIYKIPLRVLLTQVVVEGEVTEVYCRVVPPKYIRNMQKTTDFDVSLEDSTAIEQDQIGKLNAALLKIVNEYKSFISDLQIAKSSFISPDAPPPDGNISTSRADEFVSGDNRTYPEFTKDFVINFEDDENWRKSSLNRESHYQFCSVERIYYEAFKAEVESRSYNSKEELDELFLESRGPLMKNTSLEVSQATQKNILTNIPGGARARIRHLESLHTFYESPPNPDFGTDLRTYPKEDFHKTVFSLHNVLQWYLRARRPDSLWGTLTAKNTPGLGELHFAGNVPAGQGYSLVEKQIQPLVQSAATADGLRDRERPADAGVHGAVNGAVGFGQILPAPWSIAVLPRKSIVDFVNEGHEVALDAKLADGGSWPRDHIADLGHRQGARFSYYQPGFMTLCHDAIIDHGTDDDKFKPSGWRSIEVPAPDANKSITSFEKYAFKDMEKSYDTYLKGRTQSDGAGHYLTNYNRISPFIMKVNGGSPFVADGRLTVDDFSSFMRASIASVLEQANIGRATGVDLDVLVPEYGRLLNNADQSGLTKASISNAKLIQEIVTGNPALVGQNALIEAFDFGGLEETEDNLNPISNISNQTLSAVNGEFDRLIQLAIDFSKFLMYSCGVSRNYSPWTENRMANNIYNNTDEGLMYFEYLRRFFEKVKATPAEPSQKFFLLAYGSRYGYAQSVLESFARPSAIVSVERERASKKWAAVCLYYFHLLVSARQNSRNFHPWRATVSRGINGQRVITGLTSLDNAPLLGIDENHPAAEKLANLLNLVLKPLFFAPGAFSVHVNAEFRANIRQGRTPRLIGSNQMDSDLRIIYRMDELPYDNMEALLLDRQTPGYMSPEKVIEAVYAVHKAIVEAGDGRWCHEETKWIHFPGSQFGQVAATPGGIIEILKKFNGPTDDNSRLLSNNQLISKFQIRKSDGDNRPQFKSNRSQDNGIGRVNGLSNNDYHEKARRTYEDFLSTQILADIENTSQEIHIAKKQMNPTAERSVSQNRPEDILQKIDYRTYNALEGLRAQDGFLEQHLLRRGYFETGRPNNPRRYKEIVKRNTLLAPAALRLSSAKKINRFAPAVNNSPPAIAKFARKLKEDWDDAFRRNSGITRGVLLTAMNDDSIINGKLIDGLFTSSKIDQVARLVVNMQLNEAGNVDNQELNSFANRKVMQLLSEEQRSYLMNLENESSSNKILSVPVAEYKLPISTFEKDPVSDILIECAAADDIKGIFTERIPFMTQELIDTSDAKIFLKYIAPAKRMQAMSTIFATTALSGYSTMPTLMQTPKASLAYLMTVTSMNSKERAQLFNNMSQAEFYKQLADNKVSDPKGLDCFDFPQVDEFWEQFKSMLLEAILEFPSLLFRGIASTIDPAYKEMKLHWKNCDIQNLTFGGVKPYSIGQNLKAGASKTNTQKKGDSKYAPLISTSAVDLSVSLARLFSNPNAAAKGIGHTVEHMMGYIYKGPISLLDGTFQFSIPCADTSEEWPGNSSYNAGRYGHPISPLTILALITPELRGDKKLRDLNGACSDSGEAPPFSRADMESKPECPLPESAPFGGMPKPEDFDKEDD